MSLAQYIAYENRQEGIHLGKQEGKQEKAFEIAKNLLSLNADINLISQATHLDIYPLHLDLSLC